MCTKLKLSLLVIFLFTCTSAQCTGNTWYDVISGINLGMQEDNADLTTSCAIATNNFVLKLFDVYQAALAIGLEDLFKPVTMSFEAAVELNDVANACNYLGLVL